MKIEKISDTQIRCTLDRSDLHSRDLKLSELAYGTEKAKSLFHEMIEQASCEFDFEADDSPLMIEAVPVSPDCIILTITKVVHPEELDEKFPIFGPDDEDDDYTEWSDVNMEEPFDDADSAEAREADDDFIPISKTLSGAASEPENTTLPEPDVHIFCFNTWNDAANAAAAYNSVSEFASRFYKDADRGKYYLVLESDYRPNESFNAASTLFTEYSVAMNTTYVTIAYIREHCELLIRQDAIKILTEY